MNLNKNLPPNTLSFNGSYDSYDKALQDILGYLQISTEICILSPERFAATVVLFDCTDEVRSTSSIPYYTLVDIQDFIPNLLQAINIVLSSTRDKVLQSRTSSVSFLDLIVEYGTSWIPITSPDYQSTLNMKYTENINMLVWQRGLRATLSSNKVELGLLMIDPEQRVRTIAQSRYGKLFKKEGNND